MKLFKESVFAISILFVSLTFAQDGNVYLNVWGFEKIEGELSIGLYKNSQTFLKRGQGVEGIHIKVSDSLVSYVFKNIPPDNYAIAIYHDENENRELDRNFLGIPNEDYVFSNYATGILGPPSFEAAMFAHSDSTKIDLDINN
ncbi:MAG: DUF2141 domain-containing protein [Ignavibacteriae bacterium]|nr:DUF2141 domain-containing protein [Ignavibacteriota bacterium]